MEIPSNEMAAYLTKYPNLLDTLLANGYTILLSSAEVNELKADYPDGEIPQTDWDALIASGYNKKDLNDNGFKRKKLIYGH